MVYVRCRITSMMCVWCAVTRFSFIAAWFYVSNYSIRLGSCWHFPVEGQKNYCRRAWVCHCNLGAFWVAWVPLAHTCVPYSDPCLSCPFPLVQCIHLHQQVSIFLPSLVIFSPDLPENWPWNIMHQVSTPNSGSHFARGYCPGCCFCPQDWNQQSSWNPSGYCLWKGIEEIPCCMFLCPLVV